MTTVFSKNYTVTDMHADAFGRAKPSALLFFCQDIATAHAAALCGSWEQLQEKHLFWAVSRHKLIIHRPPLLGETLTLKTWPMPTAGAAYPRAVEGYDERGELVFSLGSLWVLMDTQKRTMVLPGKSDVEIPGIETDRNISLPKSLLPLKDGESITRQVTYSELDRNLHMNNTRYLDWLADLVPLSIHRDRYLSECTLCYLSETLYGQSLRLSWKMEENALRMAAWRQESTAQKRVFGAEAYFSPYVL